MTTGLTAEITEEDLLAIVTNPAEDAIKRIDSYLAELGQKGRNLEPVGNVIDCLLDVRQFVSSI